MEPELIMYKHLNDAALANALVNVLEEAGIEYDVQESSATFDPAFRNSNLTVEYSVKIRAEDFERTNQLLNDKEQENVNQADQDHYLYNN